MEVMEGFGPERCELSVLRRNISFFKTFLVMILLTFIISHLMGNLEGRGGGGAGEGPGRGWGDRFLSHVRPKM